MSDYKSLEFFRKQKQEDVELNLCNKIREHINNFGWQSLILDCHPADITPRLINLHLENESTLKDDAKLLY